MGVFEFGGSWGMHLPLAEFSYNSSYHSGNCYAPFEMWYGRKCRSPVLWAEVGTSQLIGPELERETTNKVFSYLKGELRQRVIAKGVMRMIDVSSWSLVMAIVQC